ncbi:MAG: acyl carrier protein [Lachnospiraceae bacterium]|jgi:acyl carrier protein|nr:acyl carrier protein [Lachnospiraceae bacterium]
MKEKVTKVIADYLGKDAAELDSTATFEELGLDSLDLVDLTMQIENEAGVKLESTDGITTIDQLVEALEKAGANK